MRPNPYQPPDERQRRRNRMLNVLVVVAVLGVPVAAGLVLGYLILFRLLF